METTSKNGDSLTNDELKRMLMHEKENYLSCPDCLERLMPGPCGGLSQNFLCGGCGARFNHMSVFGVDRLNDRRVKPVKESIHAKIRSLLGFARTGRTCSRAPNPHRKNECSDPKACRNPE